MVTGNGRRPRSVVPAPALWFSRPRASRPPPLGAHPRSIDEILAEARQRLRRLGPAEAYQAMGEGALLVDIRPEAQRAEQGCVPGSLHIERNVLEWRFDPQSAARLPQVTGYDVQVIVMCVEGYTSSLAAASLQDLGLARATDLDGGYRAWQRAGLPFIPGEESVTGA